MMSPIASLIRRPALGLGLAAALGLAGLAQAGTRPPNSYAVTVLVSDGTIAAAHTDPNLINGWGVAFDPSGYAWVSANGTGLSTIYDGNGDIFTPAVTIPSADGVSTATPDGIVYSGSATDFMVTEAGVSGPARFLFSSEDGVISGWAPSVDATHAVAAAVAASSVYKGITVAAASTGRRLYATDFHNAQVAVFDSSFKPFTTTGGFVNPNLPAGYAPFGIQAVGAKIYVTYGLQDALKHDAVPGYGLVGLFDVDGNFIGRGAAQVGLDEPWAVAIAPASFGHYAGRLLVGNFGSGTISAYDRVSGNFLGYLRDPTGAKIVIKGLWGLKFGNGFFNQPTNALFFAAGPVHESHGTFGRIDPQ